MSIYKMTCNNFEPISATTFQKTERDIQQLLRDQPDVVEEGLFIVSEEFSNWQDAKLRIDLLGLDSEGRLVVIELKKTETGELSDLQAIRYAAMVANMTLEQTIEAHKAYLDKRKIEEDAQKRIQQHLEITETGEIHSEKPRIVLVSAGFSIELTTSVMWLNDNYGMDIKCIRLRPHKNGTELLVESSQIIPLPEAADYMVRFKERMNEVRKEHSQKGHFVTGGNAFQEMINSAPEQFQQKLRDLYQWAVALESDGLTSLATFIGKSIGLRLNKPGNALVTIKYTPDSAWVQFWWGNIERLAPGSKPKLNELIGKIINKTAPGQLDLKDMSPELLDALRSAYEEAKGRQNGPNS